MVNCRDLFYSQKLYWLLWYCDDFEYVSKCCQFRFVLTASSSSIVFFIFAKAIDETSGHNTIGCNTLMRNHYNCDSQFAIHEYILQLAKNGWFIWGYMLKKNKKIRPFLIAKIWYIHVNFKVFVYASLKQLILNHLIKIIIKKYLTWIIQSS